LDYIGATTHKDAYQSRHTRATQLPLLEIQGFKDNERIKAESRYNAIQAWWLSLRASFEDAI
jgi:hypothetical protein